MALVPPMFGGFPPLPPTDGWNNEGSGIGSYRESPVLEIIEFKFSLSNLLYNLRQITESIPASFLHCKSQVSVISSQTRARFG